MANPRIALDGAQQYGVTVNTTGIVTINSVAYKVNKITPTRNVEEAHDNVPDGGPGRSRYTAGFDECSIEAQLADSSTPPPPFGSTFTMTLDAGYASETWIVMPNTPEQSNEPGAIRVCTFMAAKSYNPSAITTVL